MSTPAREASDRTPDSQTPSAPENIYTIPTPKKPRKPSRDGFSDDRDDPEVRSLCELMSRLNINEASDFASSSAAEVVENDKQEEMTETECQDDEGRVQSEASDAAVQLEGVDVASKDN